MARPEVTGQKVAFSPATEVSFARSPQTSVPEVCALAGLGRDTVYGIIRQGKLVAQGRAAMRLSISACSAFGSCVSGSGGTTVPVPIAARKPRWRPAASRATCPALPSSVYQLEIGGTGAAHIGSSGGLLWSFPTTRFRGLDLPVAFLTRPFLMRLLCTDMVCYSIPSKALGQQSRLTRPRQAFGVGR